MGIDLMLFGEEGVKSIQSREAVIRHVSPVKPGDKSQYSKVQVNVNVWDFIPENEVPYNAVRGIGEVVVLNEALDELASILNVTSRYWLVGENVLVLCDKRNRKYLGISPPSNSDL